MPSVRFEEIDFYSEINYNFFRYSAIVPKNLIIGDKIQFEITINEHDEPITLQSEMYSKTRSLTRRNESILTPGFT